MSSATNPAADAAFAALVELHRGLPRQGPGSDALARTVVEAIRPFLPTAPRVADLGCGSGHTARLLASWLGTVVDAVDAAPEFVAECRAAPLPAAGEVAAKVGDMLDTTLLAPPYDLIWSEGAAYAVGVERALACWRDLLAPRGVVVYSDCCWLTDAPPAATATFWRTAYPEMTTERAASARAERLGFAVLHTHTLPEQTWWDSYYGPLQRRIEGLAPTVPAGSALAAAIDEAQREMDVFRASGGSYGYVVFVLRRSQPRTRANSGPR